MGLCGSLPDPNIRAICRRLAARHQTTLADFDRGVDEVRMRDRRPALLRGIGSRDREASPREVLREAIEMAERSRDFLAFLRKGDRLQVPWSTANLGATAEGRWLKGWFERISGPDRARSLFLGLTERASGSLGLSYYFSHTEPLHDLGETLRSRRVNCLEFVYLFLMGARLAAVDAVPVQIFEDPQGTALDHVAVGLVGRDGKVETIADISLLHFGPPPRGWSWSPISKTDLLAYHYNSLAETRTEAKAQETMVDKALSLSPNNHVIRVSKAYFRYHAGDLQAARSHLQAALAAYPDYPDALRKMAVVEADIVSIKTSERP